MTTRLTTDELTYLRTQRLGRLATVDAQGAPQNNPVGFVVDDESGEIRISPDWVGSWGIASDNPDLDVHR